MVKIFLLIWSVQQGSENRIQSNQLDKTRE